jgi:hypothetical protein
MSNRGVTMRVPVVLGAVLALLLLVAGLNVVSPSTGPAHASDVLATVSAGSDPTDPTEPDPSGEPTAPPSCDAGTDVPPSAAVTATAAPVAHAGAARFVPAANKGKEVVDIFSKVAWKPGKGFNVTITIRANNDAFLCDWCRITDVKVTNPKGTTPNKDGTIDIPFDPNVKDTVAEITYTVRCESPLPNEPEDVYKRAAAITITQRANAFPDVKIEIKAVPE